MTTISWWLTSPLAYLNANGSAVTALATVAGVLVALAYSIFAGLQWRATKRQADIAKRQANITQQAFEANNRPYLSLRIEEEERSWAEPGTVKLLAVVENVGTIPAEVTKWEVSGNLMNLDGGQDAVEVVKERTPLGDSVFPREPYPVEFQFKHPGIFGTPLPLRIFATLEYRGVSMPEKTYWTALEAWRTPHEHRQRTRAT